MYTASTLAHPHSIKQKADYKTKCHFPCKDETVLHEVSETNRFQIIFTNTLYYYLSYFIHIKKDHLNSLN